MERSPTDIRILLGIAVFGIVPLDSDGLQLQERTKHRCNHGILLSVLRYFQYVDWPRRRWSTTTLSS